MTGPPAATAACRLAVRRSLADHDGPVLAAVSGGADSLALAAALAFERPGSGALVVDHGLQPGSADVAARAASQCTSLGLVARVLVVSARLSGADVDIGGRKGGSGPEAAARELRYALLEQAASSWPASSWPASSWPASSWPASSSPASNSPASNPPASNVEDRTGQGRFDPPHIREAPGADPAASAEGVTAAAQGSGRTGAGDGPGDGPGDAVVLLGHTRDDQAETVLLGLVRGSGARALSGMAPVRGRYRRPFLDLPRDLVRQACAEAGLEPWEDPHNDDPAFARVGVRKLLADLDVTEGLARSAALLREDADALDALAVATDDLTVLAAMPPAVRGRSLKLWAEQQCGRSVTSAHVGALRALVDDWRGQGPVALPGGGQVARVAGRLAFTP